MTIPEGQKCQACVWSHYANHQCGKPAKATMTGVRKEWKQEPVEVTVHLCGVHAAHARKGRAIAIDIGLTTSWQRINGARDTFSLRFEATELESLKAERKELEKSTRHEPNPGHYYQRIGAIIYRNADALESIIAALPVEQAQAIMAAVEGADQSFRDHEGRKQRLSAVTDRLKELGHA